MNFKYLTAFVLSQLCVHAAVTITKTVTQDCSATPLSNLANGGATSGATGGAVDTSKCAKDRKDSKTAGPAFAIFDNQPCGPINITGPCTRDDECGSSCCDGKKCRAPDALKGAETCRSGLAPDFTNGLKFVKKGQ
ncbi:hypothetical protein HDV02_005961 [Globomyces sp. JEL0801]|nr:hypothetical protein HDV02_005961 [Globomyces sp. JEL0801]